MRLRLIVMASVVLALLAGGGCRAQSRRDRHLRRAQQYAADGRHSEAVIAYLNALRLDSASGEALRGAGMAYAAEGNLRAAMPFLLAAAEHDPGDADLQARVAEIYLLTGAFEQARAAAERVIAAAPDALSGYVLLVDATRTDGGAEVLLERLDALAGQFGAEAGFHAALAELHVRREDFAAAEQSLRQALRISPGTARHHLALGRVYALAGDVAAARESYRTGVELAPEDPRVQISAAQFSLRTGEREEARRALAAFVARHPGAWPVHMELVRLDFEEARFEEALARVDTVLERVPDHVEALLLRSRLWLTQGRAAEAVAVLQTLAEQHPRSPRFPFDLALAQLANGAPGEALAALDQALALDPGLSHARLLRVETRMQQGDTHQVLSELRELVRELPGNRRARLLLGQAAAAMGRHGDAVDAYRQLLAGTPDDPELQVRLAGALLATGAAGEARVLLQRVLEREPGHISALAGLTELDLRENRHAAALARIRGLLEQQPETARLRYLEGAVLMGMGAHDEAGQALRMTIDLAPGMPEAYLLLGRLLATTGRGGEALAAARQAVVADPDSVAAHMLAAVLEVEAGNREGAVAAYSQALAIDARFAPALNNLAVLLAADDATLERAFELAQRARQILPENPYVADTLGWILYRRGNTQWAYALLRESADRLPAHPEVLYHLGMAQLKLGRVAEAARSLGQALELDAGFAGGAVTRRVLDMLTLAAGDSVALTDLAAARAVPPDDPAGLPARYAVASILRRQGDEPAFVQAAEELIERYGIFTPVAFELARVYLGRREHLERAYALATQVRERSADRPGTALVLGKLAHLRREHQRATVLLAEAVAASPEDTEALYMLGLSQHAAGRVAEALATLRRALERDPAAPQAAAAHELLAAAEDA